MSLNQASAVVLNSLGNAEGALGQWQSAMAHYHAAAADPEMGAIAAANYALAAFQVEDQKEAIKAARQLLRR
jgi:Tfp pilus assembly protein PilF